MSITICQLLLVLTYYMPGVEFPWWFWLFAIVVEFDHLSKNYLEIKILQLQKSVDEMRIKKIEEIERQQRGEKS